MIDPKDNKKNQEGAGENEEKNHMENEADDVRVGAGDSEHSNKEDKM